MLKNVLGEDLEDYSEKEEPFNSGEFNKTFGHQKFISGGIKIFLDSNLNFIFMHVEEAKTTNLSKASSCMAVNKIGAIQIPVTSNSVLANNSSSPEIVSRFIILKCLFKIFIFIKESKKTRLNEAHSQQNLDSEFISTTADTPTTRLNSPTSNKSILDSQNDTIFYNFDTSTPRDSNQFKMDTTTSSDSIKLEGLCLKQDYSF